jgi:hypothetical protein
MDRTKIAEALSIAMASGVDEHPGYPGTDPTSDLTLVTKATSVGVLHAETLDRLTGSLARDPAFAALASKHMALGLGGLLREVSLPQIAQAMLAQTLARRDVHRVVAEFAELFEANEAQMLVVMALTGIRVEREAQLGQTVRLVPLSAVPASIARGQALGQQTTLFAMSQTRAAATAALTITAKVVPLYAKHQDFVASLDKRRAWYFSALSELDEARNCLNLVGSCAPVAHSMWSQYLGTAAYLGGGAMWSVGDQYAPDMREVSLDLNEAESICGAYFAWSSDERKKVLHVPLDRLARAARERSAVDRAIDLGIALEALLINDDQQGELTHRLCLRGAWLGADDIRSREKLYELLSLIYRLRSKAVHRGVVGDQIGKIDTDAVLSEGITACGKLIRSVIERRGIIQDWRRIVLGG